MKTFVAESVFPEDFYERRWEGYVVEEIVRLLGGKTSYRIVMNARLLRRAIRTASENAYDIFHLSCHGDERGIQLTDAEDISWEDLAGCFQKADHMPAALVLSCCVGSDGGIARAFKECNRRPEVIFGAEAKGKHALTFPGACMSWPILYIKLVKRGMTRQAFIDAIDKMNGIAPHRFVYRRWDGDRYLRYPRAA
ncbi:MAG: hypothetical protein ABSE93_16405 [Terriglobia bacterium]